MLPFLLVTLLEAYEGALRGGVCDRGEDANAGGPLSDLGVHILVQVGNYADESAEISGA